MTHMLVDWIGFTAEAAGQLGKMVEHLNKSQPNPGPRPNGIPYSKNIFFILLKTFENESMLNGAPVVQAEEVVQEAATPLVAHLRPPRRRRRHLHADATSAVTVAASGDGTVAPEEVEAQVRNVGGPLGDAGALCYVQAVEKRTSKLLLYS